MTDESTRTVRIRRNGKTIYVQMVEKTVWNIPFGTEPPRQVVVERPIDADPTLWRLRTLNNVSGSYHPLGVRYFATEQEAWDALFFQMARGLAAAVQDLSTREQQIAYLRECYEARNLEVQSAVEVSVQ